MAQTKIKIRDIWSFRRPERVLFAWSFLAITAGYLMALMAKAGRPSPDWRELMPLAVYLAAMAGMHVVLVLIRFRGDPLLLAAVFFLAGFGMLAQFRIGSFAVSTAEKLSSFAFPAGMALMLIVVLLFRNGRYRIFRPLAIPCALASAALLAAILVWGRYYRGAVFLPGNYNPSDLIKILLIIFLSGFLARRRRDLEQTAGGLPAPPAHVLIPLFILWCIPMGLLVLQRDLGMLVLMNVVLIILLFAATGRASYVVLGVLCAGALLAVMFRFSLHSQARFLVWLDPFQDPTGKSWQVLQSLSALYSGGLWGVGLGEGSPQCIPIASSDFIYAVIGEELGFAGCGIVLVFYLVLFYRGYHVAAGIRTPFGRLLATGIVTALALQTLLNIGGVTKALPLTGITLPFISHGGSSLVTTFLSAGLLLALSEKEPPVRGAKKKPQK